LIGNDQAMAAAKTLYWIAKAQLALGQITEAKQTLKYLQQKAVYNPEALFNFGKVCVDAGMIAESIVFFRSVLDHEPGNGPSHANLALLHAAENRSHPEVVLDHAELGCQFGVSICEWQELSLQVSKHVKLEPTLVDVIMELAYKIRK
jgi:tetratricopeptide (TPR) repeat protein